MIRPSGGSQSSGPPGTGGSGGTGGGSGDLFVSFLDADEQTRHQSQSSQGGSGFQLDWPVHSTGGGGGGGGANTQSGGSGPPTSSPGGF